MDHTSGESSTSSVGRPGRREPAAAGAKHRWRPRKVPEITAFFWLIKILSTAMGEATADYLDHRIDPVLAVAGAALALAVALGLQSAVRRYVIWVYWSAVAMVAVFGTMLADALRVKLGIPYLASSIFFAVALAAVFALWHRSEGTLSIHSIDTRRREAFYWATVMATFALGTAVGDYTATALHLGYFSSGVIFAVATAVPAVAYRGGLDGVVAFWWAYILTRPLGASFADWLGVPHNLAGGLGLGRGTVGLTLTAVIVVLIAYRMATRGVTDGA